MSEATEDPDSRLIAPRLLSIPQLSVTEHLPAAADPETSAPEAETPVSTESPGEIASETPSPELSPAVIEPGSVSIESRRLGWWNSIPRLRLSQRNHQIGVALVATVLIGLGTLPFLGSSGTDNPDTIAATTPESAEHLLPTPLRASSRDDGNGFDSGEWEPVAGTSDAMQMDLDPGYLVDSEHQARVQPAVHVTELESVAPGIYQVSGQQAAARMPGTGAWLTGTIEFEAAPVSSPTVHYVRP